MGINNSKIKFHESIAIADSAFTVKGDSEEELIKNAAIAMVSVMADIGKIQAKVKREFELERKDLDILLYDFLDQLLFYKDSENLLFSGYSISIKRNGVYKLKAEIRGEEVDPDKHKVKIDVKAVTMHMFEVKKTGEGFQARIVVDI